MNVQKLKCMNDLSAKVIDLELQHITGTIATEQAKRI